MKLIRTSKGLSQQAVADYLGITQQAYANYERMTRQADYETLLKLADFFNVSVDYLLGRSEDAMLDEALSKEEFALFGEIRNLTTAEKEDVLSFIRFTKSKRADESET